MIPRPMKPTSIILNIPSLCVDRLARVPSEAFDGGCLRLVFAADPAAISDLVEISKQERIVDLAGAGFVAAGIVGELHMANAGKVLSQRRCDIALHHLHVIDVVLDEQIVRSDIGDDLNGLLGPAQEEAGNVAGVDRLDQKPNTLAGKGVRRESQIPQQHFIQFKTVCVDGRDADQAIELTAIQGFGVIDGTPHAIAEFVDPIRKDGEAPLAGAPIARGEIVQDLGQSMLLQLLAQHRLFEIIGEQIFHAAEAGGLGRGETVEERQLVEEHREIGGKFRHDRVSSRCRLLALIGGRTVPQTGTSLPRGEADGRLGVSSSGKSRISSNSTTLSISVPIAILVTRSRMNSTTTGTLYCAIHSRAVVNAAWASFGSVTRIALQPRPSATATWSTP